VPPRLRVDFPRESGHLRVSFPVIDLLLLLMAVCWGTNYSIIKNVFREIDPQAFNALRMSFASLIFLAVIVGVRVRASSGPPGMAASTDGIFYTSAKMTARDWRGLAALGFVGNCCYQYCFMGGLSRTSVANSSLMLGATPVLVALLSAMLGLERIGRLHWIGAALSTTGIYLVVGQGFSLGSHGATGDLLMFAAVCCWALYTIGARPLMTRHSPVAVTGLSMIIGTLMYVPLAWPSLRALHWSSVSASTWGWLVYSAVFALCISYTIWYAGVRQLGTARTSIYSNFVPIVAMLTAAIVLHEPLGVRKILGTAAVLAGVALTRIGAPRPLVPPQE
jgi:drug/metabolite transporter (DMT)-like permease